METETIVLDVIGTVVDEASLGEDLASLPALSNASLAELAEVSARGRLAWHAVLTPHTTASRMR